MLKLASALRVCAAIAMVMAVASCSATFRNHGYVPSDEDLSQIVVGQDNKETVTTLVGKPSAGGVLDGEAWYYVESRFRHYAYQAPQEIEREVLAISFDGNDRVANIERFGLQDGRVVTLSRRVTTSAVRDTTFLRQLLGNLGNINLGEFLN